MSAIDVSKWWRIIFGSYVERELWWIVSVPVPLQRACRTTGKRASTKAELRNLPKAAWTHSASNFNPVATASGEVDYAAGFRSRTFVVYYIPFVCPVLSAYDADNEAFPEVA